MNTNFVKCKIALTLCTLAGIMLIVSGCNKESEPTAPENQNTLIGTWPLLKIDGVAASFISIWTFSESTVTIQTEGQTFTGSYSVDQTKNPKTMDLPAPCEVCIPEMQYLAIYDFPSSSSLIIKVTNGNYVRATNFNVEPGYSLGEFAKERQLNNSPISFLLFFVLLF